MKKITLFSFALFYILIASCFNPAYSQSQFNWKALPNTYFNTSGKEISMLVNKRLKPGVYEYTFDATGWQSRVYFYKIETLRYTKTKKMIIL